MKDKVKKLLTEEVLGNDLIALNKSTKALTNKSLKFIKKRKPEKLEEMKEQVSIAEKSLKEIKGYIQDQEKKIPKEAIA